MVNPLTSCTFGDLVDSIMKYIFVISLALAPLMIVVGAILLMTAGGDPGRVRAAQQVFIWTGVGLLVVFLGRALIAAINTVIGVSP